MKKSYDDDDGRTIVDMNVDGMPGYDRFLKARPDEEAEKGKKGFFAGNTGMSDTEYKAYRFAVLKSALLILLVFILVYFLFIAFVDFVWFGN